MSLVEPADTECVIVLRPETIRGDSVFFSDKKNNIVMDGTFAKLFYSTHQFTMNGMFFYFPIHVHKTCEEDMRGNGTMALDSLTVAKKDLQYNPYHESNITLIMDICKIEEEILAQYAAMSHTTKTAQYGMKTQLFNGYIRIRSLYDSIEASRANTYVIKISGIWETAVAFGISYKIMARANPR